MEDSKRRGYRVKQVMGQDTLKAYESRCHEEDAPACQARCPLHFDARTFCGHLAAGNFDLARAQYKKEVPFPEVIARACSAPCRKSCRRQEVDRAIEMQALELVAMEKGQVPSRSKRRRRRVRQKGLAAVVGAGIAGCTVALTLLDKNYGVHLYEKESAPGGALGKDANLKDAFETDFQSLADHPESHLHFEEEVDAARLAELEGTYDAVFLTTELAEKLQLPEVVAPSFLIRDNLFGLPAHNWPEDLIHVVAQARRAAWSMDRRMQSKTICLTSGRALEGPYETELVTDTSSYTPDVPPLPAPPFTATTGIEEAGRCLQCRCLMCQAGCAYLQVYATYPKRLMRTVYNNISIVAGNRTANQFINSCALCDQCKALCPTDIDVVHMIRSARENMVETNKMPPSAHAFALLDMAHSQSEAYHLAKSDPNEPTPPYVLYPGCQLGALAPSLVEKAYLDLRNRFPEGVGLILDCCGAIADWAGRMNLYDAAMERLRDDLKNLGNPSMIVACPTCYRNISERCPEVDCIGIWDVLPEKTLASEVVPFELQEPCTLRHDWDLMRHIREEIQEKGIAFSLPEYEGVHTACCGYGGLVKFANPEVADAFARNILPQNQTALTICINCRDQILRQGGKARHLLECFYGDQPMQSPTLGARRMNCTMLQRSLLKNLWGEDVMIPEMEIGFELAEGVQEKIEARWIMAQDVQEVIQDAEATKNVIADTKTGHLFASKRIGHVTFWVEYSRKEDGFLVHDAYSHRMEIEEV